MLELAVTAPLPSQAPPVLRDDLRDRNTWLVRRAAIGVQGVT